MKQFLATGVIVMLSLGGVLAKQAAAPAGAKTAATVSQTLIDMEQQWNKASKAGDADALAVFLADDLVYLDSDGTDADEGRGAGANEEGKVDDDGAQ